MASISYEDYLQFITTYNNNNNNNKLLQSSQILPLEISQYNLSAEVLIYI